MDEVKDKVEEEVLEEEKILEEQELADILFGLTSVYTTISEMDEKILPQSRAKQLRTWKRKIWRSIDYYVNCLPYGDVDLREENE